MSEVVWVVASRETARRWAERLAADGLAVVALGWSDFRALLDASRLARLKLERGPDVLLLTSANAVRVLQGAASLGVPAACVGEATAAAARAAGLDVAWVGSGGAASLARAVAAARPGGHVLYLSGREARREGVDTLEAEGLTVDEVVAYAMEPRVSFPAEVRNAPRPALLVLGSPRAGEALAAALDASGRGALRATPTVAVGETTAHALRAAGFADVVAAQEAGVDGLARVVARRRWGTASG